MDLNKEKDIVADDITDIKLSQAGYYWEMGFNEFDFTCKIKGENDVLHLREQRHDDGSGIVIRSDKDDIWGRMTTSEVWKLDDKLQDAIQYGSYHKKIENVKSLDDVDDLKFEMMENDNVHLNRVIKKLWSELSAKEKELEKGARESVREKIKEKKAESSKQVSRSGSKQRGKAQSNDVR